MPIGKGGVARCNREEGEENEGENRYSLMRSLLVFSSTFLWNDAAESGHGVAEDKVWRSTF